MVKKAKISFAALKTKRKEKLIQSLPNIAKQMTQGMSRKKLNRILSITSSKQVKQLQTLLYHEFKKCEICKATTDEQGMLLCDRCDDCYHAFCLGYGRFTIPKGSWSCPPCIVDQDEYQQHTVVASSKELCINQTCNYCQKSIFSVIKKTKKAIKIKKVVFLTQDAALKRHWKDRIIDKYLKNRLNNPVQTKRLLQRLPKKTSLQKQINKGKYLLAFERKPYDEGAIQNKRAQEKTRRTYQKIEKNGPFKLVYINKAIKCPYCKQWAHPKICYNPKPDAINCQKCERNIKRAGPQTYQQFTEYAKKCYFEALKNHTIVGLSDKLPESYDNEDFSPDENSVGISESIKQLSIVNEQNEQIESENLNEQGLAHNQKQEELKLSKKKRTTKRQKRKSKSKQKRKRKQKQKQQLKDFIESTQQKEPKVHRMPYMGLAVPRVSFSEAQLTRQQSTLYYALTTQKMKFIDGQVYKKPTPSIQLSSQERQIIISALSIKDQIAFAEFKSKSKWGLYPSVQIVEDKTIGFYARAIATIKANTILYEYGGDVICARKSLHLKNDSIMSLIRRSSSFHSFDLCPIKYGNGSKFLSGINNKMKNSKAIENVRTLRFLFQNSVRVLFFTKTEIETGDTLYINYNAGAFEEYPTDGFVHKSL